MKRCDSGSPKPPQKQGSEKLLVPAAVFRPNRLAPTVWEFSRMFVQTPDADCAKKCQFPCLSRPAEKLQPILKVDPKDRDTWFYRECDVCFKPVCEKHSIELEGRIFCDRCRRETEEKKQPGGLIDLGIRRRPEPE